MTCNPALGVIAKITDRTQPELIKGSDFSFVTQLVYKNETCDPAKIDGFVGATGFFKNDDGTTLTVSGSLQSADLGEIAYSITAEESALLASGEEQPFEMHVDATGGLRIFQFDGKIVIRDSLFS